MNPSIHTGLVSQSCRSDPSDIRCGIDFGGVIARMMHKSDFAAEELCAQPNAFESIRTLVERVGGKVWIISKAGKRMQARTLRWLDVTDFHARTGLSAEQVLFCKARHDKSPICQSLGITHFLDDRLHLMFILRDVVPHLYLFGGAERYQHIPSFVTATPSDWIEFLEAIRGTLGE